ncbi:uncharacterized protein JCM15063_004679 [Sporobolomyces koalae]|uniref:uncharacterized protein n=1 Tax=Sporobolomyces koalae TaxID=500713 RepID=UPI0031746F30
MPPIRDPPSNRYLLLSILVLVSILLYLTTHRPETRFIPASSSRAPASNAKAALARAEHSAAQRPLVVPASDATNVPQDRIIKHRIVAIGDIHGDYSALTKILRKAALIDLKGHWIGGQTILVQTGDIVDRGADTILCYRFMQTLRPLAEKAGGAVVSLLGNHEIMNALGDWRYVSAADIQSFGGERNRRHALLSGWIGQEWRANYSITARVPYLTHTFPTESSVIELPTSRKGESDKRFVLDPEPRHSDADDDEAGAISFVHGGIIPEYLAMLDSSSTGPISTINRIGHSILTSLVEHPNSQPLSLPRDASTEQRVFWSERGPMWNREFAMDQDELSICKRVAETCKRLKVRRLVMGHTPNFEGIVERCQGRVLLIDTGISKAYGGSHSFLEIQHTLTPKSLSSSTSYNEVTTPVLAHEDNLWVEKEVVKAVYEDQGRQEEILVDFERVVEIR